MSAPDDIREFWSRHAPGLKWLPGSDRVPVSQERCAAVRAARYRLEPHLEELAGFTSHAGRVVLEGGASYVGSDSSGVAVRTARATFDLLGLPGAVLAADATAVPVRTASVDVVYSNGVLHHVPDTRGAVDEIHRVPRPGGRCVVMLYHRSSLNYPFNILVLRRLGAVLLLLPRGTRLVRMLTGESEETLAAHRDLLRRHGLRYLTDRRLFLSNNTDGPGNPLSKVFSAREARRLFAGFRQVEIEVRHLNLRTMPALDRWLGERLEQRLARRWGWHLYVLATR